jgi:sugar phosphate permease
LLPLWVRKKVGTMQAHEASTMPAATEHEKANVEAIDDNAYGDLTMDKLEYKRILRKLDWAIIPYCSLLYLLSFLDRVNIGQAAVAGLRVDLGMATGNAYQIALSVFFIGYIVVEVPSNLVLKAVKPHRWIPIIMVAWSIVMTLMGLVKNAAGLQAARFFLGKYHFSRIQSP